MGFGFDDVVDEVLCVVEELLCGVVCFVDFVDECVDGLFLCGESVVLLLDCFFVLVDLF